MNAVRTHYRHPGDPQVACNRPASRGWPSTTDWTRVDCGQCHRARERAGEWVRRPWIEWAERQPDPKPSWLTPWRKLDAAQRDADMEIGWPIIEETRREVREQIADQLDGKAAAAATRYQGPGVSLQAAAFRHAARIARDTP